jgi:hypothetical protein
MVAWDGLETLAGGHLIGQFMDPTVNLRTDRYGGSTANRCRFAIEVHEEIRKQVGDDFVVGFRFALEDGCSFEESLEMARIVQRTGLIDFFNVVYGRMDTAMSLAVNNMPGMFMPSAPWLSKAAALKQAVQLPVFHAAKISDLATARHAIREGLLDMVGMTRAHIAEPHLVRLVEEGREHEARPCVGASFCRNAKATCIHNPATSRETFLPHDVPRAARQRNVLVIGAGPAGTGSRAGECGPWASRDAGRGQLERWRPTAARGFRQLAQGPDRHCGLAAGRTRPHAGRGPLQRLRGTRRCRAAQARRRDHRDRGVPNMDLPGGEMCKSVFEALTEPPPREGSALVYDGTGRHNAYLCAERYVDAGLAVSLATIDGLPAQETGGRGDDLVWMRNIATWNAPVHNHLELRQVRRNDNGKRTATFRHLLTGKLVEHEADHIVVERGTIPAGDLFEAARMHSANDGQLDLAAFAHGKPQPAADGTGDGPFHLYRYRGRLRFARHPHGYLRCIPPLRFALNEDRKGFHMHAEASDLVAAIELVMVAFAQNDCSRLDELLCEDFHAFENGVHMTGGELVELMGRFYAEGKRYAGQ